MGRDYRIGLIAGSVLVGVALIWVATRPSLGPRLPPVPGTDQNAVGADEPAPLVPVVSPSKAVEGTGRKTEDKGQKTPDQSASPSALSHPSSRPPETAAQGQSEPGKTPRYHVVLPGETLSTIAQQYYGSTNSWRKIVAANEKTIKDSNKIAAGMKLVIPP